ncbi:MAG TPA: nucleotide exchange factor GrpE, partial [Burkholderiales bacterium]|nr:nucleotide exchange factor GrpE [Burkholderiales bacterium]
MQEESVQPQEKSLEELLAEAQAKMEQQRDTLMRALADAENARKRAQGEVASARKYALESFAEGLLPVMDSLEAARKTGDVSGVELTLKQLRSALEKSSIREIDPKPGERFDPHRHQAMAAVEAKADPNTIVTVMQKGYSLHDRVLRPALVTVAKAVEKRDGNPISDADLDQN